MVAFWKKAPKSILVISFHSLIMGKVYKMFSWVRRKRKLRFQGHLTCFQQMMYVWIKIDVEISVKIPQPKSKVDNQSIFVDKSWFQALKTIHRFLHFQVTCKKYPYSVQLWRLPLTFSRYLCPEWRGLSTHVKNDVYPIIQNFLQSQFFTKKYFVSKLTF